MGRTCPFCGNENVANAPVCVSCGKKLPAAPPPPPRTGPPPPPSRPPVPPSRPPLSPLHLGPTAELKRTQPTPTGPRPPSPGLLPPRREETPSGATTSVPPPGLEDLPSAGLGALPEPPDFGLFDSTRYTIAFARARVKRKRAIRLLQNEIQSQVAALDSVLLLLGRDVRAMKLEHRAFREEMRALDASEANRSIAEKTLGDLVSRRGEEVLKYEDIQRELSAKLATREEDAKNATRILAEMETRRKFLRERKRDLDKVHREKVKSAEAREDQADKEVTSGDDRTALRRSAHDIRREASKLSPEKEEVDKELAASEKPYREAVQKAETSRAELEAARDALERAREGHRYRLSEIEHEQGRKGTDVKLADGEIQRRLVTLGTLVNLNRLDQPELKPLYDRIDQLRAGIAAREQEVERLIAERNAYDRGGIIRGVAVLGGLVVLMITVACLLIVFL
jgi:hypothetical protein